LQFRVNVIRNLNPPINLWGKIRQHQHRNKRRRTEAFKKPLEV